MRLSTRSRYGLRAMVSIARANGDPVTSDTVAACENVSKKYLDRILGSLRAAGLLESHRGKGGGYVLARSPELISAADIVSALETGDGIVPCVPDPGACSKYDGCPTRSVWERLASAIDESLGGVTLAELAPGD